MESDQTPAESAQELAKSAQENPAAIQGEVTESEEKALTDGDENGTIKAETWYEKNIAGNPEMEQKYQAVLVKAKEESRMDGDLGSPSLPKNLSEYSFDKKHVNEERLHNVTREEAESYIREAVVRVVRNKGSYVNYYGLNGATYTLARQKIMRTSFPSSQYTPNIITLVEVMKRELGIE